MGLAPGTASATPEDDAVAAARSERDAAAAQVGAISAELAQAEASAAAAHQAAQIALQEYEERRAAQQEAQAAADAAAEAAVQAEAELARGRAQVVAFARSSYMQGSTTPGAAALMSAEGPAQLVERAALLDAAGSHRVDVVTQLTVLEAQATAAEDAAREAVQEATELEAQAGELLAAAQQQEVSARALTAELSVRRQTWEAELAEAQEVLYGAEGARDAAAAAAAAEQAAQSRPPATTSGSGSSSSGGSSSGSSSSGGASSGGASKPTGSTTAGTPTGSAVQVAIAAAKSQGGLPYSWGGGSSRGPSYGIPPDTGIFGFDCSGLTEYAYAAVGIAIGSTSRDQYWRFRDRTVAASDLQPGDLVFWANGSVYTSIYHVALYIGNGQVIQAPQSNDVVRISSMWFGSDYYGAVRPTG
ncbi:C40 family peptidase [Geodermatophilus sabuli]|uniref:C40 family peptidase n=1 Tax=Geodermatophilus sabuli TaxID=1564158 RepID=UPI0017934D6C|nr:C40 family peptidase [Geodermatophilus sabuli]MBB3085655.1 cell wall-associated NlpC family hydrolase [Geodermatophilus sabuli]